MSSVSGTPGIPDPSAGKWVETDHGASKKVHMPGGIYLIKIDFSGQKNKMSDVKSRENDIIHLALQTGVVPMGGGQSKGNLVWKIDVEGKKFTHNITVGTKPVRESGYPDFIDKMKSALSGEHNTVTISVEKLVPQTVAQSAAGKKEAESQTSTTATAVSSTAAGAPTAAASVSTKETESTKKTEAAKPKSKEAWQQIPNGMEREFTVKNKIFRLRISGPTLKDNQTEKIPKILEEHMIPIQNLAKTEGLISAKPFSVKLADIPDNVSSEQVTEKTPHLGYLRDNLKKDLEADDVTIDIEFVKESEKEKFVKPQRMIDAEKRFSESRKSAPKTPPGHSRTISTPSATPPQTPSQTPPKTPPSSSAATPPEK